MCLFKNGKHQARKSNGNFTVTYRHLDTGKSYSYIADSKKAMLRFIRKMRRKKEIVIDHFATVF